MMIPALPTLFGRVLDKPQIIIVDIGSNDMCPATCDPYTSAQELYDIINHFILTPTTFSPIQDAPNVTGREIRDLLI